MNVPPIRKTRSARTLAVGAAWLALALALALAACSSSDASPAAGQSAGGTSSGGSVAAGAANGGSTAGTGAVGIETGGAPAAGAAGLDSRAGDAGVGPLAGSGGGAAAGGAAAGGAAAGGAAAGGGAPDVGSEGDGDSRIGPNYTSQKELSDQGNPKGKSFSFVMQLADSKLFDGKDPTLTKAANTTRSINVYVPAKYLDGTPAPVLVIQDGPGELTQVARALDNLTLEPDPLRHLPAFVVVTVANGGNDSIGSERGPWSRVREQQQ